MYHCHVSFYLIGQPCRELELIQSMAPPENFTYEFHERVMRAGDFGRMRPQKRMLSWRICETGTLRSC